MREFKVGDRVKYTTMNIIGTIGLIAGDMAYMSYAENTDIKYKYKAGDGGCRGEYFMGYPLKNLKLIDEDEELLLDYKSSVESPTTIKKGQNIMSKLTNFVKNSLLSKEEKLLRKHGLKDECGEYTSEARELAIQKLMSECEDYFIETVKALESEEKENK